MIDWIKESFLKSSKNLDKTNYSIRLNHVFEEVSREYDETLRLIEQKNIENNKKMKRYADAIVLYSTFKTEKIGPLLADLISCVAGKEYVFENSNSAVRDFGEIRPKFLEDGENRKDEVFVLPTSKDGEVNFTNFYYLYHGVVDNRERMLLSTRDIMRRLPFVNEFVDMLIEERMKLDGKELSDKRLKQLQRQFILSKTDLKMCGQEEKKSYAYKP